MRIENDDRELYTEDSPTALILHAGRAMGTPMTYPKQYGLSNAVKQKLLKLFILWERQPPGSLPKLRFGEKKNSARAIEQLGTGPSKNRYNEVEESESRDREYEDDENYRDMDGYSDDDEDWDYGPQMPSLAIIERAPKSSLKH
ncbi:uncharacterized protein DFL_004807 [Arthrobotrys flagrans]|uniref:Uncharacterized protein n=1 Tax=Arthrobotrys flagrans TaxID=97331 RepID=A0A437A680_ARTFL|nr:hypothetical protein DFL_004807 [Arthrobotrys flagrans]